MFGVVFKHLCFLAGLFVVVSQRQCVLHLQPCSCETPTKLYQSFTSVSLPTDKMIVNLFSLQRYFTRIIHWPSQP